MEFLFRPIEETDPVRGIDRTRVIVVSKNNQQEKKETQTDSEKSEKELDN